jgi:hypothetical protein
MRLRTVLAPFVLVLWALGVAGCTPGDATNHVAQHAIHTNLSTYVVGDSVVVSYDNMSGSTRDWISIAVAGSPDYSFIRWAYTGGGTSGSMTFTNIPVGSYEARAYFNDTYVRQYTAAFTVTSGSATVTTDKSTYNVGNNIVVSFSGLTSPSANDWIALTFQSNNNPSTYSAWQYTGGGSSGSVTFASSGLQTGTYVARLYRNNSSIITAQSPAFTLQPRQSTTSTLVVASGITAGSSFPVTYSGMQGNATDWISVAVAGSPDSYYVQYFYTNGNTTGTLTFAGLAAGNYEARAYFNNTYTVQTRVPFTVGSGTAPPRLVAPMSTSTVTSRRPTLRWALVSGTDGAHVQICSDRACNTVVTTFDASGASGAPGVDLPTGTLFWRAYSITGGVTGTTPSAAWEFAVGAASAAVNTASGTTLDVNGDGYPDLAAGAYWAVVNGAAQAGRTHLFLGGASGLPTSPTSSLSSPDGAGNRFGHTVRSAGDVNGDGYGDLLVEGYGYPNNTDTGRAYLYLGSATGVASLPTQVLTGSAGSYFGAPLVGAGDLNGDGYGDIAVGASGYNSNTGRTYVYYGSASGLATTPSVTLDAPNGANTWFGAQLAAGDVNGDGYSDLIVGAYNNAGYVYVFLGSASGLGTTPNWSMIGPDGGTGQFGYALAAGDVNGDGYADLAVGAQQASTAGRTYLYLGTAGSVGLGLTPAATLDGPDGANTWFGRALTVTDLNADGLADLIVGANIPQAGTNGWVHVYLASTGGALPTTPSQTIAGPMVTAGGFATALATVGDTDHDGHVEIGVGSYNDDTGKVFVYTATSTGLNPTAIRTLAGPDDATSRFGISIAP